MKTYIRLKFSSKGTKPSDVCRILEGLRFVPAIGEYDFVHDWGEDREVSISDIIAKLDSIHAALAGTKVIYEVTTSDSMYDIKEVDLTDLSPGPAVVPEPSAPELKQHTPEPEPSTLEPEPSAPELEQHTPEPEPSAPELEQDTSKLEPTAPREEEVQEYKCPGCGRKAFYIEQSKRWYCRICEGYI